MEKNKLSVPISEKYLLICREAALYFNLGVKNLRCMARNPTLKIGLLLHGRFLIVRPRFEEYILQLMEDNFFDSQSSEYSHEDVV